MRFYELSGAKSPVFLYFSTIQTPTAKQDGGPFLISCMVLDSTGGRSGHPVNVLYTAVVGLGRLGAPGERSGSRRSVVEALSTAQHTASDTSSEPFSHVSIYRAQFSERRHLQHVPSLKTDLNAELQQCTLELELTVGCLLPPHQIELWTFW